MSRKRELDMSKRHVAVWIDHVHAKLFHVEPETFDVQKITAPAHELTRKAVEQGRHAGSEDYYHQIADALRSADEILLLGPSSAKLDLFRHLHRHDHLVADKVLGIESSDHPTDPQIVAHVRHYFHREDRRIPMAT